MFSNLEQALLNAIGLDPGRTVFLREPTIGSVIPDMLIGEWTDDIRLPKATFTYIEARILALIEEYDELSEAEILRHLHLSHFAACRAFSRVQRSGLVFPTRKGKLTLDAGAFTRGVRLTAVELKLSRWREALEQAQQYLRFADRAYVLLDGARVEASKQVLNGCTKLGVGLLLRREDEIQEVQQAPIQVCISPERVQAVQKVCAHLKRSGELQLRMRTPHVESVQPH